MTSEYQRQKQELADKKCNDCGGLGKQNDCEPGDISYNEWPCPACKGSGLKQA